MKLHVYCLDSIPGHFTNDTTYVLTYRVHTYIQTLCSLKFQSYIQGLYARAVGSMYVCPTALSF